MTISQKSIKLLWAGAAGRCSFDNCGVRLCDRESEHTPSYILGEMAHICGKRPGASRYDSSQNDDERDNYQNLILLCPTHHTLIDCPENEDLYTASVLLEMKSFHERQILELIEMETLHTKEQVAQAIFPLIEENRVSWEQYGPTSFLARTNPQDEGIYSIWRRERLSVIVPNNRNIVTLLREYRSLFNVQENNSIADFLLHSRSYEKWVKDEVSYLSVKRYPLSFDDLIRRLTNVCV